MGVPIEQQMRSCEEKHSEGEKCYYHSLPDYYEVYNLNPIGFDTQVFVKTINGNVSYFHMSFDNKNMEALQDMMIAGYGKPIFVRNEEGQTALGGKYVKTTLFWRTNGCDMWLTNIEKYVNKGAVVIETLEYSQYRTREETERSMKQFENLVK